MFGLNKDGFKRMRYVDLISEMNASAKSYFGQDVNLSDFSPLGMIFKVVAFVMAGVWSLAEKVYYGGYKDTAEGAQLEGVGQYVGIKKKPADRAIGIVTFTGTTGTVIPQYFIVSTGPVQFWTTETVIIPAIGYVTAHVSCLEVGLIGNVLPGKITTVVNPMIGVESVTNVYATTGGSEIETDTEFRKRYDKSISTGGASTISAVEAEVLAITEVVDALAMENTTMATVDGIPAKSIKTIVYGGSDLDIATAIYKTKGGGIQAFGATIVPIEDDKGVTHNIGFTRVVEVPIYVHIALTTDAETFPYDGNAIIKDTVVAYIGGLTSDSVEHGGLGLGDDVIFTRIIGLCHKVDGVINTVVTLSTDNITFTAANIAIDSVKKATAILANVVIS